MTATPRADPDPGQQNPRLILAELRNEDGDHRDTAAQSGIR
jgi:hypothetical protein